MAKVQKMSTQEFKREAVRLACRSSAPIAQVARELGIPDTSIHQWRKELADPAPNLWKKERFGYTLSKEQAESFCAARNVRHHASLATGD